MSSVHPLIDAAERQRSPATMPEFRAGKPPRNKGQRYPADPPTVEEIVVVRRQAQRARYGHRLNGLIVVLWRAGLRINEALSLTETVLDERRGSVLIRHGKNDRRARSAWTRGGGRHCSLADRAGKAPRRAAVLRDRRNHPRPRVGQRRPP